MTHSKGTNGTERKGPSVWCCILESSIGYIKLDTYSLNPILLYTNMLVWKTYELTKAIKAPTFDHW